MQRLDGRRRLSSCDDDDDDDDDASTTSNLRIVFPVIYQKSECYFRLQTALAEATVLLLLIDVSVHAPSSI